VTKEQELKFWDALGDGSGWPKMTDDPEVNFVVDWFVADKDDWDFSYTTWDELPEEDKIVYRYEAEHMK